MRGLSAVVILLCALSAPAAAAKERKSHSTSSSKQSGEKPAESSATETKTPARETPSSTAETSAPATHEPFAIAHTLSLGAGGFFAGGANAGPAVAAIWTLSPNWPVHRLALDVELDWRMARFSAAVDGFGTLTSTMHQVPLSPVLRIHLLEAKRVGVDARVGVGALFLVHVLSSDFAVTTTRTALGWEAFAGGQLRVGLTDGLDLMVDARFSLGEASVPFVLGRASGVEGLLGVRYALR